jgi:hypothetical protein
MKWVPKNGADWAESLFPNWSRLGMKCVPQLEQAQAGHEVCSPTGAGWA